MSTRWRSFAARPFAVTSPVLCRFPNGNRDNTIRLCVPVPIRNTRRQDHESPPLEASHSSASPPPERGDVGGKKKDTDVNVGQILTLEGGAGKALFSRQYPLSLGIRRAPQDAGADTGRDRDLPHSQRQAQMSGGVMKTRILVGTIVACLAASGLAVAQTVFTKAQVGDRIRKVEDGVDEFRKWSEKRAEEGRTPAQAAKGSARTRGKTATESQKATAQRQEGRAGRCAVGLEQVDESAAAQIRSRRQVD